MDSKFYSKLLTYLEYHNSINSQDFNVLGFKNHCEALLCLKYLHRFDDIFMVNEIKNTFWCLTDKGKDFIKNHKNTGLENAYEDSSYDVLIKIERGNSEIIDEIILKNLKEKDYIEKSEMNGLEVSKGKGFSSKLILASDLTSDMLTSELWKDVIFSSYDYKRMEKTAKYGSCHVVYNFINDVRHALFELGFKEVAIPCVLEKSFLKNHSIELLKDDFDSVYKVHLGDKIGPRAQEKINEDFSFPCLRNSLFLNLFYEISTFKTVPIKVFTVGKVFQNKEFDFLDIPEYHVLEIMISDSDLDFSNVLGICSGLFSRLNINYTDFKQAYFPYTSPTAGIYLYNEILDSWISVGKGGVIRPEFTKTLGFKDNVNVLRLGFSIERVLLNKKDIGDMAHLLR